MKTSKNGNGRKIPPERPVYLPLKPDNIPQEMRSEPRWTVWIGEFHADSNKWQKPPRKARTGQLASSTDSSTWCPFEEAMEAIAAARMDGVSFILGENSNIIGIDIDGCSKGVKLAFEVQKLL